MTKEQIITIFEEYILGDRIYISSNVSVDIETFSTLFSDSEPTYTQLVSRDGGNMGYKDFFDKLLSEGKLTR